MTTGVKVVGAGVAEKQQAAGPPDEPAGAPDGGGGGPGGGSRWWVVILAVVAVAGVAGTLGFARAWNNLRQQHDRQTAVLTTARQFTLALTNFDAKTVDADFDRIISYATGNFLGQAQSTFDTRLRQAMQARQASSRGQVRYLYVEDLSASSADVYAVIDQTIINNTFKAPEADQLRLDISFKRVRGGWRVSDLTDLQSPTVNTPLAGTTGPAAGSSTTVPAGGSTTPTSAPGGH